MSANSLPKQLIRCLSFGFKSLSEITTAKPKLDIDLFLNTLLLINQPFGEFKLLLAVFYSLFKQLIRCLSFGSNGLLKITLAKKSLGIALFLDTLLFIVQLCGKFKLLLVVFNGLSEQLIYCFSFSFNSVF